jgi:quercetin dioxygenase-like cupin family protein
MDDRSEPPPRSTTTGSDTRPARTLDRRVAAFELDAEARSLTEEPEWTDGDRNTRTLLASDGMRVALTALRAGASLGDERTNDSLTLHVLRGRLRVDEAAGADLGAGSVIALAEPSGWKATAVEDSVVLVTTALGGATRR